MLTFPTSETGYARKSMRTTALIHESNRNKNLGLDRINREISNIKTDSVWPLLLTEVSRHENDSNITKLLTLYSDPLFRPVFHLSGEDSTSPHTDYIVSHDELQGIEAKHFDPEKSNFHWWMRTLKHQRNLQDSLILLRVWKIITQVFNLFNSLLKKKKRKKNTKHKTKQNLSPNTSQNYIFCSLEVFQFIYVCPSSWLPSPLWSCLLLVEMTPWRKGCRPSVNTHPLYE